jgi:hypothetical protein
LFHLDKTGCRIYPVGVYETSSSLCLNFGQPFDLSFLAGISPDQIDELAAGRVMRAIEAAA